MHLPMYNTYEDNNYNTMMSYSDHLQSEAPRWVSEHLKAVAATVSSAAHRFRGTGGE